MLTGAAIPRVVQRFMSLNDAFPHSMLYAPRYRALVWMPLVDGSRPGTSAGRDCQGHGSSPWTGASPEATPKHGSADCNTACAPDRTRLVVLGA